MSDGKLDGESDQDFHRRLLERSRREASERLARAKARAERSRKERFDLPAFERIYRRSGPPSTATVEQRTREWEEMYYVTFEEVKTLVDFARIVELNDVYDGG